MGKQMIKYGTVLIGLFIAVAHGSDAGQLLTAGANGGTQLIKGLQGR